MWRGGVSPATGQTFTSNTFASNTFSQTALNSNIRTVILQGGIPLLAPGSFTMGNNGAITLGTALGTQWPSVYIYIQAGDIAAGVPAAAGWYYATFTGSATVGTVFNNTYTTGMPTVPAAPTAFVSTGPGARAGDTGLETAIQVTIPVLSTNSVILTSFATQETNNANAKTITLTLGGTTFHTLLATSVTRLGGTLQITNTGATNKQISQYNNFTSGTGAAEALGTIDTSTTTTLAYKLQRATATDNLLLLPPTVEVIY